MRALAAVLLGLPAALVAHALVFGGDHAVAGALQSGLCGAGALAFAFAALVHTGKRLQQGSVAAARLRLLLPNLALLLGSSGAWFALFEFCESPHAHAPVAIAAALALACVAIRSIVFVLTRALASVGFALLQAVSLAPSFTATPLRRMQRAPMPLFALAYSERLFSRPPPALS
ncbi:MAG TPA: hypothetical protein VFL13_03375 [Candidatus Baltobacteraceae bacterium]|nr:hypothetical protein [Candidatus Baltobacteraceae bacterium]